MILNKLKRILCNHADDHLTGYYDGTISYWAFFFCHLDNIASVCYTTEKHERYFVCCGGIF